MQLPELLEARAFFTAVTASLPPIASPLSQPQPTVVDDIALFANGGGYSSPDQYPGAAGGGWLSAWTRNSKAVVGTVFPGTNSKQPAPIDLTQSSFLQVQTSNHGAISRALPGTAGTSHRVIQFDYRFDGTRSGASPNDYVSIFGDTISDPRVSASEMSRDYTWAIRADINASNASWLFAGKNSSGSVSTIDNSGSEAIATKGDVYQFTINEYFSNGTGTYTATVRDTSDGDVYTTPSPIAFCSNPSTTDHIVFGAALAGRESGKFSIDSIHIATVTTPPPVVFVIGGFGTPQAPTSGTKDVQQLLEPFFNYDGFDAATFRYYEENYDTDKSINPHGDSITAEIDKVPASTPVVVMGFSFGGDQAFYSSADASRTVNDLILFDPVIKAIIDNQVEDITTDPTRYDLNLGSNIQYTDDNARQIFESSGKLYPGGPYSFTVSGQPGTYENLSFPHASGHASGQVTPFQGTAGFGASGDPINDTAELVENALDGFPMFWDGIEAGTE